MNKRSNTKDPKTMTTAELRAELDDFQVNFQALMEHKEKLEKMLNKQ